MTGSKGTGDPITPDAVYQFGRHQVKAPIDAGAPGADVVERRPRWLRLVTWAALVLGALFLVATARLFVWPPSDAPAKVDAILALGGDPGQLRAKEGVSLAEAGYAPVVVVSLGGYPPVACPTAKGGVRVICFRANPLDTRGEVEFGNHLAAHYHWTSMLMVPERDQATRARLLFRRCSDMHLVVVPVTAQRGALPYDIAYEWAALVKAFLVHTSC
jgi:uncharacterized SAM-binding protein YcdF (DUF218 family)